MIKIKSQEITIDILKNVGKEELVITHKNEDFYFKLDIKNNSNKIAIHTNGAVDYTIKTPPVYQRSTWAKKINTHCIFIDDRTLHNVTDKKFNTAWLIGTKNRYYVEDYVEIIKIIQKVLEVDNKNIYYWGSSAGGTASIALATLHRDTTAIANNPQTNILKDHDRRRNAIFRNVFSDENQEDVIKNHYHRLTLAALMIHHDYVPRLFYIQNFRYTPDLERHYQPFIEELEEAKMNFENITIWLYNDNERGHGPLLPEKTLEYLNTIMSFKHL